MVRHIGTRLSLLAAIMMILTSAPQDAHIVVAASPGTGARSIQQFSTGGQVLGFQSTGIYAAAPSHALHIEFVDARPVQPQADRTPDAGQVLPLSRVTWRGLWPGVDLTYQATAGGLAESVYTIAAGASARAIRLRYNAPTHIDGDGSLVTDFATGQMRESAPVAWQEIADRRVAVGVAFAPAGADEMGFAVGRFDPAYPLTIDPRLTWNTFLSGSDQDQGKAIAVDGSGNIYVAGNSNLEWGLPVRPYTVGRVVGLPNTDAFVAKLSAGGALLWNTFLGGTKDDSGEAIGLDGAGNVYVAGQSYATWGTPIRSFGDQGDSFVARLSPTGALQWNTFLGGAGSDYVHDVAVTATGNVYAVGESGQTWGAPVHAFTGSNDVFLALLSSAGALQWNTFLGGVGADYGNGLALDTGGNIYVSGQSTQTWGAPKHTCPAIGCNGFVAKVHSTGALEWNTFLGAQDSESAADIAVDGAGYIYVAGRDGTTSHAFAAKLDLLGAPVWDTPLGSLNGQARAIAVDASGHAYVAGVSNSSWGTPRRAYTQDADGFVAQLNTTTGLLQWNTFLGGTGQDQMPALVVDSVANVYVAGTSRYSWASPVIPLRGVGDGFAAKLSSDGYLTWNSFVGGSDDDFGKAIAVDAAGYIYVAGTSNNTWGAPVRDYAGGNDAFVAKLDSTGNRIWNTFLGGTGYDDATAVAVDASGNVYVAGQSYAAWGTPLRAYSGSSDGFVAGLDSIGALQWLAFLGGPAGDGIGGLGLDDNHYVYVAGYSTGTWGSPVRGFSSGSDAFAARLSPSGTLLWNTFLGGTGTDGAQAVALNGHAYLYVAGDSSAGWGTGVRPYSAGVDGFASRLDPATGALQWNTFLGGSGTDRAAAVALDTAGNIYVAGASSVTWAAPITAFGGVDDAFAARLNTNGSLGWNTFLGGTGADYGTGIAVDAQGGVLVVGSSSASWGTPASPYVGAGDGFVARLSAGGARVWNTFEGGPAGDTDTAVVVDPSGNIYEAGYSAAEWGPSHLYVGGWDAFVAKLDTRSALFLPLLVK